MSISITIAMPIVYWYYSLL